MAKKSNKTEHVLNLITKGEEQPDIENADAAEVHQQEPVVDVSIKETEAKELKIERKLTVEIEPDIYIKPSIQEEEELVVKAPEVKVSEARTSEVRTPEAKTENIEEKRAYLINLTERFVMEMVDDVMQKTNVCTCTICKNDVLALALNSLPQHYVTSDAGKQYLQLDIYRKQHETDVLSALIKACVRVKASPKHAER